MILYGDPFAPCWVQIDGSIIETLSVPSAVVRAYTHQGFVVAADGLKVKREAGTDECIPLEKCVQKIFRATGPDRDLAYSFTGTLGLSATPSDEETRLDLTKEIHSAVQALSSRSCTNLYGFAERLGRAVHKAIVAAQANGPLEPFPEDDKGELEGEYTIFRLFLDGYYKKRPERGQVRFYHHNQVLAEPENKNQDLFPGCEYISGSGVIADLLFGRKDERFRKYWADKYMDGNSVTIQQEIETAKGYIAACSDPELRFLDERYCAKIGGHIHIATITPLDGFQWVPGFEPTRLVPADPKHDR